MNLKVPFAITFIIGCCLFAYSLKLPYYTNQKAYDDLNDLMYEKMEGDFDSAKKIYYKKVAAIKTSKIDFMDLGTGLSIFSGTILLLLFVKKINRVNELHRLKTFKLATIFISANVLWLLYIPATTWYYTFTGARGDYPWFADSIGIPIMEVIFGVAIGIIPLNIFLGISSIGSVYPSRIFMKPTHYNGNIIFKEIFWCLILILYALVSVSQIISGDHFNIIISLCFFYLVLMLRARNLSSEEGFQHHEQSIPNL